MNFATSLLISSVLFFTVITPVSAQTQQPSLEDHTASQSAATPAEDAEGILTYMIGIVTGIDSFVGGFVFSTPDVFANPVTLPGGGEFGGFAEFRNVFTAIAVGIIAIILAIIGINIVLEQEALQLQPLLFRFLLTGALFFALPFILGLTIEGTNLLNDQILALGRQSSTDIAYGQLIIDILSDMLSQIQAGANPSVFGFPNTQISIFGNLIGSIAVFLFQNFILLLTFLFFLLGFLFIIFQFVIRFVSLLFLSILFPFVVPFALSTRTQGVVKTFLMAWVGFLIHQPAFILGYMIVLLIFNSLLTTQGASLGMLFLYSGSLFFLAGVNTLVNRIFGEPWTAIGTNIQAAVAAASVAAPLYKFKQGMVGGNAKGFTNLVGRDVARKFNWLSRDGRDFSLTGVKTPQSETSDSGTQPTHKKQFPRGQSIQTEKKPIPSLTQEIKARNIPIESVNRKTGETYLQKTPVYAYDHPEKPLVVNYLSKGDAVKDGLRPDQLRKTSLAGKLADYSAFYKTGVANPYNTNATNVKKQTGSTGNAHAKLTSSENWMRDHMTLNKNYFEKRGIKGVIGKRNGNYNGSRNTEKVVRIYTLQN